MDSPQNSVPAAGRRTQQAYMAMAPERYGLRRDGESIFVHDRMAGEDLIGANRDGELGHLYYELLGIAAAILNGYVPYEGDERVSAKLFFERYRVAFGANRRDDQPANFPDVRIDDSDSDVKGILSAVREPGQDAANARAVRALKAVKDGLNALNYQWRMPHSAEEAFDVPIPLWALPPSDRLAVAAGEEGSWLAQLGEAALRCSHVDDEPWLSPTWGIGFYPGPEASAGYPWR